MGRLTAVGTAAEIIKIDAEILDLRGKLKDEDAKQARQRIDELLRKRQDLLSELERKANKRMG
jgi:ElaB/YqjD/DUF883 family membrane-anchored ribosome-binding protein